MYIDRATLRLTDAQQAEFLAAHRWGRLATVSPDGEPHVTPIGYVLHNGLIYFHALTRSRRGRDLAAGSRVCLCVDDGVGEDQGYRDRRGVVLYGVCRQLGTEDDALRQQIRARFAEAFFGDAAHQFERSTHAWYEITPYRHTSWDFGRIPDGADRAATSLPPTTRRS